jgi:hypothetical protein
MLVETDIANECDYNVNCSEAMVLEQKLLIIITVGCCPPYRNTPTSRMTDGTYKCRWAAGMFCNQMHTRINSLETIHKQPTGRMHAITKTKLHGSLQHAREQAVIAYRFLSIGFVNSSPLRTAALFTSVGTQTVVL